MSLPERDASSHEPFGQVESGEHRVVGRLLHRLGVEDDRRHQALHGDERQADLVGGVEERLFVLLQVVVVGEREPLQSGQETRQVAHQPPRLAPGQLGDVRVLLLGEHGAPRRPGVVEAEEAELRCGVDDDLLPQPRQVHADEGDVEERLGDEVPVAHGVERVLCPSGHAELGGDIVGPERERAPGEGTGPEGGDVEPLHGGEQPVDVSGKGPAVGEQVVGQQYGLSPLHVGVPGKIRLPGTDSPALESPLQLEHQVGDPDQLLPGVEAHRRGHLVVPTPAAVQLGTGLAGELPDAPLDRRVDVLVAWLELEHAGGELVTGTAQGVDQQASLRLVDDGGPLEAVHMRDRGLDVEGREPAVERQARREGHHLRCRRPAHAVSPERHVAVPPASPAPPPWRAAHVSMPRPNRRTNPSASS